MVKLKDLTKGYNRGDSLLCSNCGEYEDNSKMWLFIRKTPEQKINEPDDPMFCGHCLLKLSPTGDHDEIKKKADEMGIRQRICFSNEFHEEIERHAKWKDEQQEIDNSKNELKNRICLLLTVHFPLSSEITRKYVVDEIIKEVEKGEE